MAYPIDLLTLDLPKLQRMPAAQIFAVGDALRTLDDVLTGLCAQGRFMSDQVGVFNDAGDILSHISDYLTHAIEATKSEANRRCEKPLSKTEARWLGLAQIQYEARFIEHPSALAVVVAQAIVTEENANG